MLASNSAVSVIHHSRLAAFPLVRGKPAVSSVVNPNQRRINSSNAEILWPEKVDVLKTRGFCSEEKLVQAILGCVKRAQRRDFRVELEVEAGVGVADIVLTKRSPDSTGGLYSLSRISPRLAILLSTDIGSSIRSREDLATWLGTSETVAQRVVAQLVVAGLASQSRDSFRISTVSRLPFETLIAIEAKISDWQRVLIQAYRNRQFADESWAVIDHAFIGPAIARIDRFRAAGVGLASVDREHGLFIHYSAISNHPMSRAKRWQAQAVLASRVLLTRRMLASL